LIYGEPNEISILTISKHKQLIFVEGNEYTGYRHLADRHSSFSYKNYWKIDKDGNLKLDNPSKFDPEFRPIIDFILIAEAVFEIGHKNITNNTRPDIFDKYTGYFVSSKNISEKFHLLTYKDTKIVHTLFPDKKTHNVKVNCRFGKGTVSSFYKFPEAHNDLFFPYYTSNGIVAYSILIRKYFLKGIERLIIQKHDKAGEVYEQFMLEEKFLNNFAKFEFEDIHRLQISDTSNLEKVITQIDNMTAME